MCEHILQILRIAKVPKISLIHMYSWKWYHYKIYKQCICKYTYIYSAAFAYTIWQINKYHTDQRKLKQ